MTVEKIPMEEETEVPTIPLIPDEIFTLEKEYYHGVHVVLHLNKEDDVGGM